MKYLKSEKPGIKIDLQLTFNIIMENRTEKINLQERRLLLKGHELKIFEAEQTLFFERN